jgi:hypothetical protein
MLAYADVCLRMLAYADVCGRMRTYADVCGRMLTCYSPLSAASQVIIISSFIAFYNSKRLIPEILLARHLLALPEALVTGVYRRLCVYARETCVCVREREREREKVREERERNRQRDADNSRTDGG